MSNYSEILLEENPYMYRNPSRRKRRKNPIANPTAALGSVEDFFQGIKPMDAGCAVAGFAGATMLPGLLVKDANTTGKKVGKLFLALGSAGLVGLAAKSVGGMSGARAAVAGGMAGALAQAFSGFFGVSIGTPQLGAIRRIGSSTMASPAYSREGETVSLITP